MSTSPSTTRAVRGPDADAVDGADAARRQKAMTIGAVCKALEQEFPDISISKIRYLEDQKLLAPRRTPGGYRALRAERRAAPAHDPAPAARRVPAAARDPPGARGRARRRRRSRRRRRGPTCAAVRRPAVSGQRARARCTRSRTSSRRPRADPKLVARARGVRRDQGRAARGRALLRRDRARDRARRHRARALRRRRAQPARVPHVGRPRGRRCCSRSSPRRCARAIPSAARRRSRRSRTWPPWRPTSSTCC